MARRIVTQELVFEAANALAAEGVEPTTKRIQARIDVGSYSTVQKFFFEWKQQQTAAATAAQPIPPEVQTKGLEFARSLWTLATSEAQAQFEQARDAAKVEVAALRAELAETEAEIARLEQIEATHEEAIEQQAVKLRDVEMALVEAKTQAIRVADLEKSIAELRAERDKSLADLRAELEASRKEATQGAVEAAKSAGVAQALQAQLAELMKAIQAKREK